jgi:hypothetical protein
MSFRKLRIVGSAVCGIACLVLCVFWLKSYFVHGKSFPGGFWVDSRSSSFFFRIARSSYRCPYVFPIMLLAALTATPWIQWSRRFSLYNVLFSMTLIAAVLALIFCAPSK